MSLVDSHCHLDSPGLAERLPEVLARAKAAGIDRMVTISTRVARFETYRALSEAHPEVFFTIGTHPHQAGEEPDVPASEIVALSRHPRCIGIGEAGLDYHYDTAPRDVQQKVFRTHIAAARESGLPLVIHAREADEDVGRILTEEMARGPFKAVLHCFSSGRRLAEIGVELGLFVSFSGIVTFRNSDEIRSIAKECRTSAFWSRPTRPIWRRCRIGAGRTSRPSSPTPPGCWPRPWGLPPTRWRASPPPISTACSTRPPRTAEGSDRMPTLTLRILGCGSSGGVPRVGYGWGACDPADSRNRRRRCSLLVERRDAEDQATTVLVDTSPDLREQLLDAGCSASTASCSPIPTPTTPTASTTCARW